MDASKPASTTPNIHGGTARRARNRKHRRELARAWVREVIQRDAPHLLSDSRSLVVSSKEVDKLCATLSSKSALDEVRWAHNYLSEILRKGTEDLDWAVETYPPQIISLPRPPSPFRPEAFAKTAILSEIVRRHELGLQDPSCLEQMNGKTTDALEAGPSRQLRSRRLSPIEIQEAQLVFSAIVFGGLIEKTLIYDLHNSIEKCLYNYEDEIWVDFLLSSEAGQRQQYRRWFPDPITACLILRHQIAKVPWSHKTPGSLRKLLLRYLKHLGVHFVKDRPEQQTEFSETPMRVHFTGIDTRIFESRPKFTQSSEFEFLLDAAEARLQTIVPSVLIGFARSLRSGVSLPPDAWWRTLTNKIVKTAVMNTQASESATSAGLLDRVEGWPDVPPEGAPKAKHSAQSKLFTEMRRCFGKGNQFVRPAAAQRALSRLLQSRQSEFGPMLSSITAWAGWCLTDRTIGKGTLVAKSIRRYLGSIGRRLVDHGGHLNPRKMSPEEFHSLFDRIASSISSRRERQFALERLQEFHEYLASTLEIEPLKEGFRGDKRASESIPDANLITEEEFRAILSQIRFWVHDPRKQEMLLNITTLAYRLGLRRDEIQGLQLNSIHGINQTGKMTTRPLIWVHTTNYSPIKSSASLRRLPLVALLSDEELEQLVKWVLRRHREDGPDSTGNGLLFCEASQQTTKLQDDGNFQLITLAIRAVTGDPDIRFHHFRHSFITLVIARLLVAAEQGWDNTALPKTWVAEGHLSGIGLLRRLFGSEGPIRPAIYQVGALAGHLDPQETLQTYCHSLDWLLGRYLAFTDWPISLKLLAAVDGRTESAIAVARHRDRSGAGRPGMADVRRSLSRLIRLARKSKHAIFATQPELVERVMAPPPQFKVRTHALTDLTLDEAYALALSGKRPMSQKARAALFELPAPSVSDFLSTASSLSATRTGARTKEQKRFRFLRHQNRRTRMPLTTRQPEILGVGPALPKTAGERREGREIFKKLIDAQQKDPTAICEQLDCLLRVGSRTESGLRISNPKDAAQLGALFKIAGIGSQRIKVRVLALPRREVSKSDLRDRIAKLLRVSKSSISFDETAGLSKTRSPIGNSLITVIERPAASSHRGQRAAYGWKVACFYALVILRVATTTGYQMKLL